MHPFVFKPVNLPAGTEVLRQQLRRFLQAEIDAGTFVPSRNTWSDTNAAFSRQCGCPLYPSDASAEKRGGNLCGARSDTKKKPK